MVRQKIPTADLIQLACDRREQKRQGSFWQKKYYGTGANDYRMVMSWHKSIERVKSLHTDKDEPIDHKFYDSDESTPAEASPKGEDYCPKYPDFFIPEPSSPKAAKLESKIGSGEAQKKNQGVKG